MIKSVVIGAGRIALSHLPHILFHKKIKLVAIVEPNFIARFLFRRLTRVPVFSDLNKIDVKSYDAVFILTPPSTHFALAKSVITRHKSIFIEKPLTLNPSESHQLIELAKSNNVQLSVGYVYRFHPVFMFMKSLIDSQESSKVTSASVRMQGNVVSRSMPKTWRNTGVGAGCIYDYGCHAIDLCLYFFGLPSSFECVDKEELFREGVVDKFSAVLTYQRDFAVEIACNWANPNIRKAGIEIEVDCEGQVFWTNGQQLTVRGRGGFDYSIKDMNTDVSFYLRGEEFQTQLDHFVTNVVERKFDYASAEEAAICDSVISYLHECRI